MKNFNLYLNRHVPRDERGEFFGDDPGCRILNYDGGNKIMTVGSTHPRETKDTFRDRIHPEYLEDVIDIEETFSR
jgi:hypothetical protein